MIKRISFVACLLTFFTFSGKGQDAASPFSSFGIGNIDGMGLIQNESMGGLGIGTGSYWNINNINPSMLMYSKNTIFGELTVFQTGIMSESRTIRSEQSSEISKGAGLSYLITGFPIIKNKWFAVMGMRPFAVSNYNLNYTTPIPGSGTEAYIKEIGSGGINQLFVSQGFSLSKNINVGLTSHILFGSGIKEFQSTVDTQNDPSAYKSTIYQRTTVNGMLFRGGISYQDSIKRVNKTPLAVTFGAIYDLQKKVKATEFETLQLRSLNESIIDSDTLVNSVPGNINMPSSFGIGMSIADGFKWSVGVDFGVKKYSQLAVFGIKQNTKDGFYIGTGAEITPNAFSIDNYLERVTYRFGLRYENSPYLINGMDVNDFGINFGVSFPIVPSTGANNVLNKGFSSVDFGFTYGIQGKRENNLLEEEYFKFKFGVTFNDKWFVRRKFN